MEGYDDWQTERSLIEANHYMLRYEVATDVTFLVGANKERIRAHKYVLVSRSPVLSETLTGHMEDSSIGISVPDIDVTTFKAVLTFFYTDYVDLHTGNVTSLLYAARKFAVKDLTSSCFRFLDSEIDASNVCHIMEQAHMYKEETLRQKCLQLIHANGSEVLGTKSFTSVCFDCLSDILKSDDLKADEEDIFEAIILWSNEECRRQKLRPTDENRRKVIGSLLYLIRFTTMDVTYFTQYVSFREILSHDESVAIYQFFHGELRSLPRKFISRERNRIKSNKIRPKPHSLSHLNEPMKLEGLSNTQKRYANSNKSNSNSNKPTLSFNKPNRVRFNVNEKGPINSPIILPPPRSPNMSKVSRFRTYDGLWNQNRFPDAIAFTCSSPIVLYGVEIFGSAHGQEAYKVTLSLYDDLQDEVRHIEVVITTDCIRKTYEVLFARPIRIPPRRVFTVVLAMKGGATVKGVDGTSIHVIGGVTFEFRDSKLSSNGTDVTVGQIPSLLFNNTD